MRSRGALRIVIALCLGMAAAAPGRAEEAVTVDLGYSLIRHALMVTCSYETADRFFIALSAGGWYWPSVQTGLEGHVMDHVFDGDARLAAGYSLRLGERVTVSVGPYAGAWIYHSREAIVVERLGISAALAGFQFAPRAGLCADVRWFAFGAWGFRLGLSAPWQLFRFTPLGLSEAFTQIGIEAGACVRLAD